MYIHATIYLLSAKMGSVVDVEHFIADGNVNVHCQTFLPLVFKDTNYRVGQIKRRHFTFLLVTN